MDLTKIPEVETVERVSPEPGDVFVLSCEQPLSPNTVAHIRRAWENAVPGTHAVVLSEGLKIQKLQPRMTETINALDALVPGETAHGDAHDILLNFLEMAGFSAIADAWKAAGDRCAFYFE